MEKNFALAELLFPHLPRTPEQIEQSYPKRELGEGVKVTRIAPSPTGFMHLGNFYGALIDERLAHGSGGVFYLRIEDTDQKRKVEGAEALILSVFSEYGLILDEGVTTQGHMGSYGPYRQSERKEIYQAYAKQLVQKGLAYPCFCTEEQLEQLRHSQQEKKENFGYYGSYAACRNLSFEQMEEKIKAGAPFVLRFRSPGQEGRKIKFTDLVKGTLELDENTQDYVVLKSDGVPTYHFAHAVDDTLMGTTHVVRGEEWLSTLPFHLQLFAAMEKKPPKYLHTAHLMKLDDGAKRKLSKRKDPESTMEYYTKEGFPAESVIEYLMTLINSNYEEWRMANPEKPHSDFPFSPKKMSVSGALFDMDKLLDVSKNTIARMSAQQVFEQALVWAARYDAALYDALDGARAYALAVLSIGRGGPKPRKDFATFAQMKQAIGFFYPQWFEPGAPYPETVSGEDRREILSRFAQGYDENEDGQQWFERVKQLAQALGYAPSPKQYKADPTAYKGHVGDVSMVLRVAVTGRQNSPDLRDVMAVLGKEEVTRRLQAAAR